MYKRQVKGAPFRYRGAVNVEECKTAADVMSAASLDWQVEISTGVSGDVWRL